VVVSDVSRASPPVIDTAEEPGSPRSLVARRNSTTASTNVLKVLDLLAGRGRVSLVETAESLAVSTSTAYRLLATLEAFDLADRLPVGGYRPGARLLRWTSSVLVHLDTRTFAEPILKALVAKSGDYVYLSLLRESGLAVVDELAPRPGQPPFEEGDPSAPLHATAMGKAVAIHLEPLRLARLLGPEPYERYSEATLTAWRELRADLDEARTRGYTTAVDEIRPGWTGVAAAIFAGGDVIGSVSAFGPTADYDEARTALVGRWVMAAAAEITERETSRPRAVDPDDSPF